MSDTTQENGTPGIEVMEKALAPLVSAQFLTAYYTLLGNARQRGDERPDEEIFGDCLGDFYVISQIIERVLKGGEGIDPETFARSKQDR